MQCQHRSKSDKPCKNKTIANSNYCYLKSHYPTSQEFEITKAKIYDQFSDDYVELDQFLVFDVDGDGACLYRSFAQALFKRLDTITDDHPLYQDITNIIQDTSQEFLTLEEETDLAEFLQQTIKNWLYQHKDNIFEPMQCKIKELIEATHEMSIEVYRIIYGIYAGKPDFLMVEKNGVHSVKEIPSRWGGMPEQYAFSTIFNFNVKVYDLITIDRRKLNIKKAGMRHKIKRLRLLQNFTCESDENTVNLCYIEIKGFPHYMYLHS